MPSDAAGGPSGAGSKAPKTFVLGLGAQKAGTTWLYDYLKRSPAFAHGYFKEYHVFDAVDMDWLWRGRVNQKAEEALGALKRGEPENAFQLHRASMVADERFYFDYFAGLLRSRPRFRLTADVTPEYALLSRERLAGIKESFHRRRIRTLALFLMRDPVDRIWSQIRMQKGRQPDLYPAPAEELLRERFADPRYLYEPMSRYERTLENLDAVFAPEEIVHGFYEDLFSADEVRRICDQLGLEYRDPDFDRRRNVSAVGAAEGLPDDLVRTVATHLSETYEAVAARFPDRDLTLLWPSARFVL